MGNLSINRILEAGTTSSLASCSTGGDSFLNSGIEFLRVENLHATQAYNVTVTTQVTTVTSLGYGTVTKSSVVKQVSAGNTAYIGPFKQKAFNDSEEQVQLTYLTTGGAALSTIGVASVHKLKVEVLYLDQTYN
jgi:hypothetical protein